MAGVSSHDLQAKANSMAKKKVRPVGRPTKYRPEMCKRIDKYIDKCLNPKEGKTKRLPTRAGVAILLRISLETLTTWGNKYPEFIGALRGVAINQQEELINRSFEGSGNATIGKMLLSANHGMSERTEVEHSGEIGLTGLLNALDGKSRGLPSE